MKQAEQLAAKREAKAAEIEVQQYESQLRYAARVVATAEKHAQDLARRRMVSTKHREQAEVVAKSKEEQRQVEADRHLQERVRNKALEAVQ